MGAMKNMIDSRDELRPLWRRLRAAKTGEAQARLVWLASGLIDDEGYALRPSGIFGETRHAPVHRKLGFRVEMDRLLRSIEAEVA